MPNQNSGRPKKAYMVSLRHKLAHYYRREQAEQSTPDRRWLNGFMAAGFHSGLISLSELKLEYMKAYRNAYDERMSAACNLSKSDKTLFAFCADKGFSFDEVSDRLRKLGKDF